MFYKVLPDHVWRCVCWYCGQILGGKIQNATRKIVTSVSSTHFVKKIDVNYMIYYVTVATYTCTYSTFCCTYVLEAFEIVWLGANTPTVLTINCSSKQSRLNHFMTIYPIGSHLKMLRWNRGNIHKMIISADRNFSNFAFHHLKMHKSMIYNLAAAGGILYFSCRMHCIYTLCKGPF